MKKILIITTLLALIFSCSAQQKASQGIDIKKYARLEGLFILNGDTVSILLDSADVERIISAHQTDTQNIGGYKIYKNSASSIVFDYGNNYDAQIYSGVSGASYSSVQGGAYLKTSNVVTLAAGGNDAIYNGINFKINGDTAVTKHFLDSMFATIGLGLGIGDVLFADTADVIATKSDLVNLGGAGEIDTVGVPVQYQIGVFDAANRLKGYSDFRFTDTILSAGAFYKATWEPTGQAYLKYNGDLHSRYLYTGDAHGSYNGTRTGCEISPLGSIVCTWNDNDVVLIRPSLSGGYGYTAFEFNTAATFITGDTIFSVQNNKVKILTITPDETRFDNTSVYISGQVENSNSILLNVSENNIDKFYIKQDSVVITTLIKTPIYKKSKPSWFSIGTDGTWRSMDSISLASAVLKIDFDFDTWFKDRHKGELLYPSTINNTVEWGYGLQQPADTLGLDLIINRLNGFGELNAMAIADTRQTVKYLSWAIAALSVGVIVLLVLCILLYKQQYENVL